MHEDVRKHFGCCYASSPAHVCVHVCVCLSYFRQGTLPPSELLLVVEGCDGGPLV